MKLQEKLIEEESEKPHVNKNSDVSNSSLKKLVYKIA